MSAGRRFPLFCTSHSCNLKHCPRLFLVDFVSHSLTRLLIVERTGKSFRSSRNVNAFCFSASFLPFVLVAPPPSYSHTLAANLIVFRFVAFPARPASNLVRKNITARTGEYGDAGGWRGS